MPLYKNGCFPSARLIRMTGEDFGKLKLSLVTGLILLSRKVSKENHKNTQSSPEGNNEHAVFPIAIKCQARAGPPWPSGIAQTLIYANHKWLQLQPGLHHVRTGKASLEMCGSTAVSLHSRNLPFLRKHQVMMVLSYLHSSALRDKAQTLSPVLKAHKLTKNI